MVAIMVGRILGHHDDDPYDSGSGLPTTAMSENCMRILASSQPPKTVDLTGFLPKLLHTARPVRRRWMPPRQRTARS